MRFVGVLRSLGQKLAQFGGSVSLILHFVGPHLGWFVAFGWHRYVEAVAFCKVISRTNANRRRHIRHQLVMLGIILLENAYHSFSADRVNTFPRCVKENIVALTCRA